MQKVTRTAILCGFALALVAMSADSNRAEARSGYLKGFKGLYKNLEKQVGEKKCNVCHFGKKKKNRNDYGKALSKIVKKNEKDKKKIKEALKKVEKEKSSVKDKTFGDLIKDGKLPGTDPKK